MSFQTLQSFFFNVEEIGIKSRNQVNASPTAKRRKEVKNVELTLLIVMKNDVFSHGTETVMKSILCLQKINSGLLLTTRGFFFFFFLSSEG